VVVWLSSNGTGQVKSCGHANTGLLNARLKCWTLEFRIEGIR